jgi:hypothetical protein
MNFNIGVMARQLWVLIDKSPRRRFSAYLRSFFGSHYVIIRNRLTREIQVERPAHS